MNSSSEWDQEYFYFSLNNKNMLLNKEYESSPPLMIDEEDRNLIHKWSADYLTPSEATILDEAWGNLNNQNTRYVCVNFESCSLYSQKHLHFEN